uniref:Uncharacterized protein n=1 Tax=Panthera tigris altaica TaxID=74533 RepID=A0A8C9JDI5_PANTA
IRNRLSGYHRSYFYMEKTPRVLKVAKFFSYSKNMTRILPCKFLPSYRIILLEWEYQQLQH